MSHIVLENVSVEFPIFNIASRSLKKSLLNKATGGSIASDSSGHIVVKGLNNINLKINSGDRVGILGHNGAGKSTLLRVLAGVYFPSTGTASINGRVMSLINITLGIDPEATGRENIYIRGNLLGLSNSFIKEHINDIIEFSELGDYIDIPVRTYSSGMQLRLSFAVSTSLNPEILLMDEWLSVGDETFKKKSEQRMESIINNSNILVIASHSRELISKICTRIIWLEHGTLKEDTDVTSGLNKYFNDR